MIDLIDFYYGEAINIVTVNKAKEIVKNLFQHANHRYPYDDLMCLYITKDTLLASNIPKYIEELFTHIQHNHQCDFM